MEVSAWESSGSFDIAQPVLDTPRIREACRKLGLSLEDLRHRTFDSFAAPGDSKEKQQLRFEHHDKKRKDHLAQVLAERSKVIAERSQTPPVLGVHSSHFLSTLESLFDKEAKRLETDLKWQLRSRDNRLNDDRAHISKEETCLVMDKYRNDRCTAATQMRQQEADRVRRMNEKRTNLHREIYRNLEEQLCNKQIISNDELEAEMERLQRFMTEKNAASSDKVAVWKAKTEAMKSKTQERSAKSQEHGEARLKAATARAAAAEARREEDAKGLALRCDEQHLKFMDVRQQRDRIHRVEEHRREEVKGHRDRNSERIETILALKEQLLEQRRARNQKSEASRNSRGLSLRKDSAPGPGQYDAPSGCLNESAVPKITPSSKPSFIDEHVKVTAAIPAPGAYEAWVLPNGDRLDRAAPAAVDFGSCQKTTYLDDAVRLKESVPAPGRYEAPSRLNQRAPRMRRRYVDDNGIDPKSAKRLPVWARPGTETPGPASYSVDTYQRQELLRKVRKSLPNLTRDILQLIPVSKGAKELPSRARTC